MIKGIYHCHSVYSYDGFNTLDEVVLWGKDNGFKFIILTEHSNDFTEEKFSNYFNHCKEISIDFILIPGIEYEFIINEKVVHVGVIGLDKFIDVNNKKIKIDDFLDRVKESGGISVLHHPYRIIDEFNKETLTRFDFIEMWNLVHDIKYSPNNKIVKKSISMGFSGCYLSSRDIHKFDEGTNYPFIEISQNKKNLNAKNVIDNIKNKKYFVVNKNLKIFPDGRIFSNNYANIILTWISVIHQNTYEFIRNCYKKVIKRKPPKWIVRSLK